jgi:hypothetical protein
MRNCRRPRVNLLTNARPRRYCRILFDGCGPQPPSHRPMWSTRIGGLRPRFAPLDLLPGRRLARRHVREANDRNGLRSDPGQSARSVQTSDSTSSRCHGRSPVSRRCIGAALSAAHPKQNEHGKPASTFNMGRRIMAERRRHRRERRRQHRPHVRTNANNQIDAQCDEPLRAFVRALARQAARELFKAQRTRHCTEIH